MVYMGYRVCKNSKEKAGDSTYWKQLWRAHRNLGLVNPDPRALLVEHPTLNIQEKQGQRHEIILMFDGNQEFGPSNRGINIL